MATQAVTLSVAHGEQGCILTVQAFGLVVGVPLTAEAAAHLAGLLRPAA